MFRFIWIANLSVAVFTLYTSNSSVFPITAENFNKLVMDSDEVWIIEFYAPWCGHCKHFAPEYQKAAGALKGVVKVGAVNMDEYQNLGKHFDIKGYPTLKIFGYDKNVPEDYTAKRTAQGLVNAALTALTNKVYAQLNKGITKNKKQSMYSEDVEELTDQNFNSAVESSTDMWLVKFYAPWCGACRNSAPHWTDVANTLKGKIKVGAIDVTKNEKIAGRFKIQSLPTTKLFKNGQFHEFNMGKSPLDTINWAMTKFIENIPDPNLTQIVDDDTFRMVCAENQLCVISFLPDIRDCNSKCRNSYIELIKDVSKDFKKHMWGWTWIEGGTQIELEKCLDVGGSGYPDMAAVNVRRQKSSLFLGSFSKKGIDEFLSELSLGRGISRLINCDLMILSSSVWDGEDIELETIETFSGFGEIWDRDQNDLTTEWNLTEESDQEVHVGKDEL